MADQAADILLVEDCHTDAELTFRALRRHSRDSHLLWLRDGAEALDYLFRAGAHAGRPDKAPRLVLLDLQLPRLPGMEVLAAIKGNAGTRDIPVVILSSSPDDSDMAECYRLNANSYIVKPMDFEQFVDVVAFANFYWLEINQLPAASPVLA